MGSDGHIWIMIHSGSRNLGKQVADYYNDVAVKLNESFHSKVPKKAQLAFLPINTEEAMHYMLEMQYCVEFALANRKLMMNKVCSAFSQMVAGFNQANPFDDDTPLDVEDLSINIAHNYASIEHHYGKNCIVHRKGAILARNGTIGIIPGSQGTKSYIVEGKGNEESFMSCSHGAGRIMGRKAAIRNLDLAGEIKKLDDLGVVHDIRVEDDLDEAPGAYKDIATVMKRQEDLVDIRVELTPLAVIKG